MRRVVQSRTGEEGTCFRTCLASLLNLQESQIPDFPDANEDPYVNTFLAKHGLKYEEIPYDAEQPPVGEHLILGISPRGGMHAVVGVNGVVKMDPHPMDGTGRGIAKPLKYGVLTKILGSKARDAAKDTKEQDIVAQWQRYGNNRKAMEKLAMMALPGGVLSRYHPGAITVYRGEMPGKSKSAETHGTGWSKTKSGASGYGKLRELSLTNTTPAISVPSVMHGTKKLSPYDKEVFIAPLNKMCGKDALPASRILKYDIADMLDRVGVTPTEFLRRDSEQRRRLLETAFQELSKEKGGSAEARAKDSANEEMKLRALMERLEAKYETARGAAGIAAEVRKRRGERIQSAREQKARTRAFNAYFEYNSARMALEAYRKAKAKDSALESKPSMLEILDTLGIDIKEFMRRTEAQKEQLLKTARLAIKEKAMGKDGGSLRNNAPFKKGDRVVVEGQHGKLQGFSSGGWVVRLDDMRILYGVPKASIESLLPVKKATDSSDRRSRLHRALDAVMDSSAAAEAHKELERLLHLKRALDPVQQRRLKELLAKVKSTKDSANEECPACHKLVATNAAGKMAFHGKAGRSVLDPTGPHCPGSGKSTK